MVIAVDFDGTIVTHKYPKIGKPLPFAFETLLTLQKEGNDLILWTVREEHLLNEAVDFCKKNGLVFYAINENYPGENLPGNEKLSRKIVADFYIDDRNVGGLPNWGEIYNIIHTSN